MVCDDVVRRMLVVAAVAVALGCQPSERPPEALVLSSVPFTDTPGQEQIFTALTGTLGKHLKREVTFEPGTSYDQVVERLLRSEVDVAFLGGASYLTARKRGGVSAILMTIRREQARYRGEIIVGADSPIQ